MTQNERIIKHLQKRDITSLDAFVKYGISRLSAVICRLKKQGYNITSTLTPVKDRYGMTTYVSKYHLESK